MKNTLAFVLAGLLMLTTVGMASAADRVDKESTNYRKGFEDGCTTQLAYETVVFSERNWVLDDTMFNGNRNYQQGWFDGRKRCKDRLPPRWWMDLWGPAYERMKIHEVLQTATSSL